MKFKVGDKIRLPDIGEEFQILEIMDTSFSSGHWHYHIRRPYYDSQYMCKAMEIDHRYILHKAPVRCPDIWTKLND